MRILRRAALLAVLALVLPTAALAASAGQPFPSNLYTTGDATQATGLRVDLPKPDCASRPSDCADIDVLNTLDGFNIQPRISIPFSGADRSLDRHRAPTSSSSAPATTWSGSTRSCGSRAANTLHFESDQQLDQSLDVPARRHARRPRRGRRTARHDDVPARPELRPDEGSGAEGVPQGAARRAAMARQSACRPTTSPPRASSRRRPSPRSRTKIRAQLQAAPVPCRSTSAAGERTVFPLSIVTSIFWQPPDRPSASLATTCRAPALGVFAGVGTVAFGTYASPDYENAAQGDPRVRDLDRHAGSCSRRTRSQFTLFAARRPKPAGGWPVAIFGHGFTDSKNGAPWAVASYARDATASRRSRSTSSATAFGPAGTLHRDDAARAPGDAAARRARRSTRTATAPSTRPRA